MHIIGSGVTILIEQVVVDFVASAVHIALCQQSQNGIHSSVMIGVSWVFRVDCLIDELGNSYLVDMSVHFESLANLRHVAATSSKDDATQQFVGIFGRNLEPYILHDLLNTCFHNLDELLAFHHAVFVYRVVECWVDIAVLCISLAIFEFHLLGILLFDLQAGDVFCDIVTTEWNDRKMTQDTLAVD